MKKNFRRILVTAVAVTSLTLTGCGAGGENGSGKEGSSASASGEAIDVNPAGDYNEQERDAIKDGGELVLPITEISEQQNTFQADGTLYTKNVWKLYNPQVGLFSGDGEFIPNPDYLTDVKDEEVDGKTVVTFTINPKATYNDGTPIDWKVFEHTWKTNNGEDEAYNVSSTDGYDQIESVTKGKDDREAVVTFKQAYPWWQGLFNYLLHPKVDSADAFNTAYLSELHPEWGAGPFKVEDYDFQSGEVTFVRNEKWWGDPAKLDKVTYRQMEDQASINAFKAGEVDATGVATRDRYEAAKGMGDQADIRAALLPANYLVVLNSQAPNLGDDTVREAIMTAIDRAQMASIRFNGIGYTEDLPGSLTLYQTQEGYKDNFAEVVSFDPEKAKSLLDEAGWKEGSDGVRAKDGEKLTLRYVITGDSPMVTATATAIQKMLRDVGIDLQIEERPSSEFSNIMTDRDFDIIAMGFRSSDPFGVAYFKQTWASDSELNKSGTGSEEFDAKIAELQQLPTKEEQIERANELEKEAFGFFGLMPYANGPDMTATKPGLANFGAYSFAQVPWEDVGWEKDAK